MENGAGLNWMNPEERMMDQLKERDILIAGQTLVSSRQFQKYQNRRRIAAAAVALFTTRAICIDRNRANRSRR